jgi:DNA-binding transcriptional MerR regulator
MTAPQLLTLKEIAKEIGVPESSVRKYREIFNDYIPGVGAGRARRYREDAVAVFQDIRNLREDMHMPWEAIAGKLGEKYAINAMSTPEAPAPYAPGLPGIPAVQARESVPAPSQHAAPAPAQTAVAPDMDAQFRRLLHANEKQVMMVNAIGVELLHAVERHREETARQMHELFRKFADHTTSFTRTLTTLSQEEKILLHDALTRLDGIEKSVGEMQSTVLKSMRLGEVKEKMLLMKQRIDDKDRAIAEMHASMETMRRENIDLRAYKQQKPIFAEAPAAKPHRELKTPPKKSSFLQKLVGKKSE